MAIIDVTNVRKVYRVNKKQEGLRGSFLGLFHRKQEEIVAVNDISFQLQHGEFVGFLGPNGAGKTTVLKMLSGLLYPTAGSARVLGYVPWERADAFRRQFSVVLGQKNQLWWDLPAHDSFLLNREIYRIPKADFDGRIKKLAQLLQVEDKLHIQVRKLSLGERMKAEIIAALLHHPRVLFLDEPTMGLDVVSQRTIREFLKEFNRNEGTTVILTSHYMGDITALCERVMVINHGNLLYDGELTGLVERYAPVRSVTVTIQGRMPSQEEMATYGKVTIYEPPRVELRVERSLVTEMARHLLTTLPISDITVEDPPIEEVIGRYFTAVNEPAQPPQPPPEEKPREMEP